MRWPFDQHIFAANNPFAIDGVIDAVIGAALSNALLAAGMALVVYAVTRIARRPAVVHALWLLVLLKLLTPPVWTVPVSWKIPAPADDPGSMAAAPTQGVLMGDSVPSDEAGPIPFDPLPLEIAGTGIVRPEIPSPIEAPPLPRYSVPWTTVLTFAALAAWGIGSLACAGVVGTRLWRFSRLLKHADVAPEELEEEVKLLARRVGIHNAPRAVLLPGAVCPMLFATFSATLLLPRDLWRQLEPSQRRTLLLHELAHLRRRDHWVRFVEVLATVLFWWHPVTWIARRAMRDAEEQCCDAWVVWAAPSSAREYSEALLEAVDFVSAFETSARPSVPALASGMGEFHSLKRRLTMIKRGDTPRGLGWAGFSLLCAAAAVTLPLRPTWAQEEPAALEPSPAPVSAEGGIEFVEPVAPVVPAPANPFAPAQPVEPAGVPILKDVPGLGRLFQANQAPAAAPTAQPVPVPVPGEADPFADEAANLERELRRSEAQLQRAQAEFERARAMLHESQMRHQQFQARQQVGRAENLAREARAARTATRSTPARVVQPRPGAATPPPVALPPGAHPPVQPPRAEIPPAAGGMGGGMPGTGGISPARREDQDRRIASLEERLDTLVNELRAIRQEIKDRPDAPTPNPVRR